MVREFLWNSRRPKVAAAQVHKPRKEGGLGILPLDVQSTAIFASFVAKTLRQPAGPWWAPVARWAWQQVMVQASLDMTDLLRPNLPRTGTRRLPQFWQRCLATWRLCGGSLPSPIPSSSLAVLCGAPFNHPAVAQLFDPTASQKKVIRQNGMNTIADIYERDRNTGAAVTKKGNRVKPVVQIIRANRLIWRPEITQQMIDFLASPERSLIWKHVQLGGTSLDRYRPKLGRLTTLPSSTSTPRWDRWGLEEASQARFNWEHISRTPLETKHLSLVWLLAQAAVPTAAALTHCVLGLSPNCQVCNVSVENIQHYFWACRRTRHYWLLVSRFLTNIQPAEHPVTVTVEKPQVAAGFSKWAHVLPNAHTVHGLAVWEIYRAHAELNDDEVRTSDQMFIRFKSMLTLRVLHDLHYAYAVRKSDDVFRNRWLKVPNRWFHVEPGGQDQQDRLVFSGVSPSDPRFNYFVDSNGRICSTTEPSVADPAA